MIRTKDRFITPELISLEYIQASLAARATAFVIDFIIYFLLISLSIALVGLFLFYVGASRNHQYFLIALFYIYLFLCIWFVPVFIEVWTNGGSVGKKMVGIRVLKDDGTPIGWREAIIRRLILSFACIGLFLLAMPSIFGITVLMIILHPQGKGLGDLIANTSVFKDPYLQQHSNLSVVPVATPIALKTPVDTKMQISLVQFAQIGRNLTPEHSKYLLDLIPDISYAPENPSEPQGVERIIGIANQILGRNETV